ncbi:MAG: hypothetical protein JXR73_06770 [Candidatus Omnitrophica bacterium]|nr:hypothetical protein [Candidatus Omnitrophota bacterium]
MNSKHLQYPYKIVCLTAALAILISSIGGWACSCGPSCHQSQSDAAEKQTASQDDEHSCCAGAEQKEAAQTNSEQCKTCDKLSGECSCAADIQLDQASLPGNVLSAVERINHLKTPHCLMPSFHIDSYSFHQNRLERIDSSNPKRQTQAPLYLFLGVILI